VTTGFLERFPDPGPLLRLQGDAAVGVHGLLDVFGSLAADRDGSPLAGVVTALGQVRAATDIDVTGLTTRLPDALEVLRAALPSSALEYVEGIEQAYTAAQDFLTDSPLVQQIGQGASLQDTALAVIQDALTRFESGLTDLAGNLVDPHTLDAVRGAFADIERFRTDYAGNRDSFLPFLAENLLGVAPDVLKGPLDQVQACVAVLAPLDPAALGQAVGPAGAAIADATTGLLAAVDTLDPAAAGGYATIRARLDDLDAAVEAIDGGLTGVYGALGDLVDAHHWDTVFAAYRTALDAVDIGHVPTVDDVVATITGALEELLGRLFVVLDADDLAARVGLLVQSIDDTVATTGLGRARDAVGDFLDEIRQAVMSVPTDEIAHAVQTMLGRVKAALDELGIDTVTQQLDAAFARVDKVVGQVLTTQLVGRVTAALDAAVNAVGSLPVDALAGELDAVLKQLGDLITEITQALQGPLGQVSAFAAQLDTLSFRPVADDVIAQIDDVKGRLQEINPNALSEPERLALQAALAVLRSIDLEGTVVTGLKQGFATAQGGVTDLLAQLGRIVARVRAHVEQFSPDAALQPLDALLAEATDQVHRVNATVLLRPLYQVVDDVVSTLDDVSPGRLLQPLQAPYDTLLAAVGRIDPGQWVAPLRTLYAEIDRLIGLVDVTPLFEELDRRRTDLLTHVRSALLEALSGLDLPQPLGAVLDAVRPFVEAITGALLGGNLATAVPALGADLQAGLDLAAPLRLLDAPFEELLQMLDAVPQGALAEALETLRTSIGTGLDALDPRAILTRLREGQGRLAALAAPVVLAAPLRLPAVRAAFDVRVAAAPPERVAAVAAVRAHFEASFSRVDPSAPGSTTSRLSRAQQDVTDRLARGIATLDPARVEGAYARVRGDLDHLVPDFLRGAQPLTPAQIQAGLASMRPSAKAAPVEALVRRFLVRAQSLQDAIGDAVAAVFGALGRLLSLVDPLSLRDKVAAIYQALRDKAHVIDPDALAQSLRETFTPLLAPLNAIDPSAIGQRLDQSFRRAVSAVHDDARAVLDALARAVDGKLASVRAAVEHVIGSVRQTLQKARQDLQAVLEQVEQLVLVEVLDRLDRLVANLGVSFGAELDRVRNAFDDMLAAIPLGGGGTNAAAAVA